MPYLKKEDRERLKKDPISKTGGDMNYQINLILFHAFKNWNSVKIVILGKRNNLKFPAKEIAKILNDYLDDQKIQYSRINNCMGALINGIFEFIRRNPCNMSMMMSATLGKITYDFAALWYIRNAGKYEEDKKNENGDVYPKET